jgi:hypothetical protein
MKYMLLIYGAEGCWTDAERRACMIESLGVCDELSARGKYLAASPLQSVATAASVRVRDGRALVTDGPFAETREILGGYYPILAEDRDTAVRLAAQHPGARVGTVEVRPVFDVSGLRKSS